MTAGRPPAPKVRRPRGEDGGVWIRVGVLGGLALYALLVVMLIAGFTPILPFVILPPIVVGLIGANSLLGGGRRATRTPRPIRPRPVERGQAPPSEGAEVNGRTGEPPAPHDESAGEASSLEEPAPAADPAGPDPGEAGPADPGGEPPGAGG